MGLGAGLAVVSHTQLQTVCENLSGYGRDHGNGLVHRGGCQHFWLDADRHRRDRRHQPMGAGCDRSTLAVSVAGQFIDAVCGLLSRADRSHHHPGADLVAHLFAIGH